MYEQSHWSSWVRFMSSNSSKAFQQSVMLRAITCYGAIRMEYRESCQTCPRNKVTISVCQMELKRCSRPDVEEKANVSHAKHTSSSNDIALLEHRHTEGHVGV